MQSLVRFQLVNGEHMTRVVGGDMETAFYKVCEAIDASTESGTEWIIFSDDLSAVNMSQISSFEVIGEKPEID